MELQASDLRLSHEYGRGFTLSLHIENSDDVGEISSFVNAHKTAYAKVKLTNWTDTRTLTANAYMWVLVDKIAYKMRLPKDEIYIKYIKQLAGNSDIVCVTDKAVERFVNDWKSRGIGWVTETAESKLAGCKTVTVYYGSSSFDKATMHRFIEMIVEDARQLGIETMTPDDLRRMMEEW